MVKINCESNILHHAATAAAVGAIAVKFGHSFIFSPFAHLGALQGGLFAGVTALVARVTENFFRDHNILANNPTLRKVTAYSIGMFVAGSVSVTIASVGATASVSILGAVALAAIAFSVSTMKASISA